MRASGWQVSALEWVASPVLTAKCTKASGNMTCPTAKDKSLSETSPPTPATGRMASKTGKEHRNGPSTLPTTSALTRTTNGMAVEPTTSNKETSIPATS